MYEMCRMLSRALYKADLRSYPGKLVINAKNEPQQSDIVIATPLQALEQYRPLLTNVIFTAIDSCEMVSEDST